MESNANVLKEKDYSHLIIKYTGENKERVRLDASLRYFDIKTCYIGFSLPIKYNKPKKNSLIEITAYTQEGIYTTNVKLRNANMSNNDMIFEVETPKTWTFVQRRSGSRKNIELPISVTFSESVKIDTVTSDFSVGGLAFETKDIPEDCNLRICTISIKFPDNIHINFKDNTLTASAKIVRAIDLGYGAKRYACSFIALQPQIKEVLRNFLMSYR